MKRGLVAAAFLAALVGCGGGGHEKVLEEVLVTLERIGECLEGCTSRMACEEAEPHLEALLTELTRIRERAAELDPQHAGNIEKQRGIFEERLQAAQARIDHESARLRADPKAESILGDLLESLHELR